MTTKGKMPLSEAMIQAEIYHRCRLAGIPVALELSVPHGRLDVAIFNQECSRLLGVIEVKKSDVARTNTHQCRRYEAIGVPFLVVNRINLISAMDWIKALSGGVEWHEVQAMAVPTHLQRSRRSKRRASDFYWDEDLNLKK